jgi:hypothetical protein
MLVLQNNFYLSIFNGRKNWVDLLITNISQQDGKRERKKKMALFLGFGNATTICCPKLFYKIL